MKRIKRPSSEYWLQCRVAEYLDSHKKRPLWQADSSGIRTSIGAAVKMKRQGRKKGFPDVFIYRIKWIKDINGNLISPEYFGLAIEIKTKAGEPYLDTKKGVLHEEQKEWLKRLNENGYKAVVCYGYEECIKAIDDYLGV